MSGSNQAPNGWPCSGCYGQLVEDLPVNRRAPGVSDRGAPIARPPPYVGVPIGSVHRDDDPVAAFLRGVGTRGVALPGDSAVEALALADDVGLFTLDERAGLEVDLVGPCAFQACVRGGVSTRALPVSGMLPSAA